MCPTKHIDLDMVKFADMVVNDTPMGEIFFTQLDIFKQEFKNDPHLSEFGERFYK